mmetsp:Transcript_29771/g.68896  ORF Transcript_29771/g.68896 Transcript_29771/m.68896 type:complete len:123 (-) Transcript_29771:35-403(-)
MLIFLGERKAAAPAMEAAILAFSSFWDIVTNSYRSAHGGTQASMRTNEAREAIQTATEAVALLHQLCIHAKNSAWTTAGHTARTATINTLTQAMSPFTNKLLHLMFLRHRLWCHLVLGRHPA